LDSEYKTKRVVVIDDSPVVREVIISNLKKIGFEEDNIFEAEDGSGGVNLLRSGKIDLIISDWNMPKMSGLELLKNIRNDENLKDTPVLMVTAEALKENIIEAVKAGVSNYIIKPFTAETMQEKLEKIFSS